MSKPHCIKKLPMKILLRDVSEEEANEYIRKHSREHYEMPSDYDIRSICILGEAPTLIGIKEKKKKILFRFTRPCLGTDVMEMDTTQEEIEKIRSEIRKD